MPEFKLKDRDGKEQTYNRDVITVPGTNGEKLPFSYGEAQSEVPIELDFASGDMKITADDGTLVKSAVIAKPTNLTPENIAEGVEIAGILGTCKGGGGDFDFDDENLKYFAFNFDIENKSIILHQILYDVIYAETGSYDVTIPNKLGNFDVVIKSS